eukprot:31566-Pelagococcus_subviridis.AAC.13
MRDACDEGLGRCESRAGGSGDEEGSLRRVRAGRPRVSKCRARSSSGYCRIVKSAATGMRFCERERAAL